MSHGPAVPPPIRPAATVVVLRDAPSGPEVFMVRRHQASVFLGGAHVFPGGRVDDGDRGVADTSWCDGLDASRALPGLEATTSTAHFVAAARELFEEAGVLLARQPNGCFESMREQSTHERYLAERGHLHTGRRTLREIVTSSGLRLALDAIVPFAHWVTPPVDVRRFDTWFFLCSVPPDQFPAHDEHETTESAWMAPAAALALMRAGDIDLPIPTWTSMRELEPFATAADALAWARTRTIVRREPRLVERDGVKMLLLPGDPENPEGAGPDVPPETRFVYEAGRWTPYAPDAYNRGRSSS